MRAHQFPPMDCSLPAYASCSHARVGLHCTILCMVELVEKHYGAPNSKQGVCPSFGERRAARPAVASSPEEGFTVASSPVRCPSNNPLVDFHYLVTNEIIMSLLFCSYTCASEPVRHSRRAFCPTRSGKQHSVVLRQPPLHNVSRLRCLQRRRDLSTRIN